MYMYYFSRIGGSGIGSSGVDSVYFCQIIWIISILMIRGRQASPSAKFLLVLRH